MRRISSLFILVLFSILCSCSTSFERNDYYLFAMSTEIAISFYNVENSKEIAGKIEEIYMKYSNVASDFESGMGVKNVYDLNQERTISARAELIEMIEFAEKMKEDTKGYFEPLLGRLSHAWKDALGKGILLEEKFINNELEIIKNSHIVIEGNTVSIVGDANLDLGGIAKGYATNKAKEYLDSIGVTSYMLNAGSSNLILGNKNGDFFNVGFADPLKKVNYKILKLKGVCVGTSSIQYQHSLINDVYYSHLLNPKTGMPATYYDSISIFGENSGILDAYSTACFAMEFEEMSKFLKEKGYHFIGVKDNESIVSEGFIYEEN